MGTEKAEFALTGGFLQIKLDGVKIENGSINATDLSSLLNALNQLLQTANKEFYGKDSKIELRFNGSEKGSFIAYFAAIAEYAGQANALLELLFNCVDLGGGTITLLKWLKGKKPDKIEQKDGDTYIHVGDNYFITPPESLKLAQTPRIRAAAQKFAGLTAKKDIESLTASIPYSQPIKLNEEDIKSFAESEDKDSIPINENERIAILEIISPDFDSSKNWLVSEGDKPFNVCIEDETFLNQVKNKEKIFGKGDCIKCLISERQYSSEHKLRKETDILEILDFIESKPAKQLELYF